MSVHVSMTDPVCLVALDYLRREFGMLPSDVNSIVVAGAQDDVTTITVTMLVRPAAAVRPRSTL